MDTKPPTFIFFSELKKRVPWSRVSIWNKMREGEFPMARDIGGKSAWLESEIDAWILSRPIKALKPLDAPKALPVWLRKNKKKVPRRKKAA